MYVVEQGPRDGLLTSAFELCYTSAEDGVEYRVPLTEALRVPFEDCRRVREFPSYKGQGHHSGRGGAPRCTGTSATSPGWNAITSWRWTLTRR